jgi:uncharacterized phiE125 gp8 family phage protein
MNWTLDLVAPAGAEPIDLATAKAHLRVISNAEDTLITSLSKAAREDVENYTGRSLIATTWRQSGAGFVDVIELLKSPASSVSSIQYVDEAGATLTLSASVYRLVTSSDPAAAAPARVELVDGESWPAVAVRPDAVRINFVAGYASAAAVPPSMVAAILLVLGDLYENREAQGRENTYQPNPTVSRLLNPYRMTWV